MKRQKIIKKKTYSNQKTLFRRRFVVFVQQEEKHWSGKVKAVAETKPVCRETNANVAEAKSAGTMTNPVIVVITTNLQKRFQLIIL